MEQLCEIKDAVFEKLDAIMDTIADYIKEKYGVHMTALIIIISNVEKQRKSSFKQ